jgi:class 3 adenylate cyclase
VEHHLSVILAADVVGYSRLMEQDEAGTFERLRTYRKDLFEPGIEMRHGRIFKLMGDGLLAEFPSAIDAVECAVVLQRSMAERNSAVDEDRRVDIRIGINLGEVIVEEDDRYGEDVNIAARLQQLTEPGGICISGKVAAEVRKKLAVGLEPMGEHRVKNIAEPITLFRVRLDEAPARGHRLDADGVRRNGSGRPSLGHSSCLRSAEPLSRPRTGGGQTGLRPSTSRALPFCRLAT